MNHRTTALGLTSGGLDSMLAARLLQVQGIDVQWVCFETPFFSAAKARSAAARLDIPLTVQNITAEFVEMLRNPPCGYGKSMNPCMDCHALMFRLAGVIMQQQGYDFMFSGEVLGQRPMSQTRSSLRYVEKHSGYTGSILRPLSAKLLPAIPVEIEGRVNRQHLLGLQGRSRKPQIQLAERLGITEYPAPAGGCLLTDPSFGARLQHLFTIQDKFTEGDFYLLRFGRHIRMGKKSKVIVGRTKSDNEDILNHYDPRRHILLKAAKIPGPLALMAAPADEKDLHEAAGICAGYGKTPKHQSVWVDMAAPGERRSIKVAPIAPAQLRDRII